MKTFGMIAFSLFVAVGGAYSQTANNSAAPVPPSTTPQVVDIGPNHRVWQWQSYEVLANGQTVAHNHKYTELASGLNYLNSNGQWLPSQAVIEPYAQGAISQQGQHTLIFANNLNSSGAIDEQTPEGKRLTSNFIGLMYYDPTTGQSVQIAVVQDSEGQLVAANQVLYTNAFNGNGVTADVLYTYNIGGMIQDVILRSQLPAPQALGLSSSESVELVAITEFIDPPEATVWNMGTDADGLEPDQAISWGATSLGRGKAFSLDGQDVPARVIKQYVNVNGLHYLLEKVRYLDIQPALSALPEQASNARRMPGSAGLASRHFQFPKAPTARTAAHPIRFTLGKRPDKGYVLDYVSLNTAYTNFTFQGDTTYYLSGALTLSGTNTFEGNTVLKYASNASINIVPTLYTPGINWQGTAYRPVMLTAKDDNTTGESISGSTGNPSGYYANPALELICPSQTYTITDFRISYAQQAIEAVSGGTWTFCDGQINKCQNGIEPSSGPVVAVKNVLFNQVQTNFNNSFAAQVSVENSTFSSSSFLCNFNNSSQISVLYCTNCVFSGITNLQNSVANCSVAGGFNGFYKTPEFGGNPITNTFYPFQTAGAGGYYLTNGCLFRNAGTPNVSLCTLTNIAVRTTYAPIIYSNITISVATNLTPQAQRDYVGNPDQGFHYAPLDYVFGNVIDKSNLTFAAGTAVGWFYQSSGGAYGLAMGDSATAAFNGIVTSPCHCVRYSMVQESVNGNWTPQSWLTGITGQTYVNAPPGLTAQFTIFSVPPTEAGPYADNHSTLFVFRGNNCEFYSGAGGAYYASHNITNCLFVNGAPGLWENYGTASMSLVNCTFFRGNLVADHVGGGNWPVNIYNCAFDLTTLYMNAEGNPTNGYYTDYNSFVANLSTNYYTDYFGGHERLLTNSYNWQTSWFGNYYLPTNSPLIQAGNTNANLLGLYHFTTQTNQVPETNSIVTIGYHYVATDAYGNTLDTNGDGIPDYLEDANGDGIFDSGDLADWQISPYGLAGANKLQVFTPLK